MDHIGIIGAGAWGTALAAATRRAGRRVTLWAREDEVVRSIAQDRVNALFLPGVTLDADIAATGDLATAARADAILLVTPAQHARATAAALAPHLPRAAPVVICAKGIEGKTCALLSEALAEALPDTPIAVLSGPSFAREVANALPAALTLACADRALGAALVKALGSNRLRLYQSDDVIGAQVGGAVKNVIAIACGVVMGRKLGDNARAALVTRGLAEMTRLARAKGGRAETMMGLSGLGDLMLTCAGPQSRNLSFGMALGEGVAVADALAKSRGVVEGASTASSVVALAARLGVEMPISAAVDAVVNGGADLDRAIEALLARPVASESGY